MVPFLFLLPGSAALLWALYQASRIGQRPKGYPPGPPTLPILGNLHQIPKERPHEQLQKWAEEYGPVYSLMLGMTTLIILSEDKAVKELMDKRSSIYSSRPDLYVFQTLASGGLRFSLMPYSNTWRKLRRCVHSILNIRAARTYVPYQDVENRLMMVSLLDSPDNFANHIRRYTDSLTTQMIFGYRTSSPDDPRVLAMQRNFSRTASLADAASSALLDIFPPLRRLPSWVLPSKKYAQSIHQAEKSLYMDCWLGAKKDLKEGKTKVCFSAELIKAQAAEGLSDDLAAYTSGVVHEAGYDTTAATITSFVRALLLHPEVQKRGQEEVDRVCGDRLPMIEDIESMPYLRACVKESLRWCPILPQGLPHSPIQDDEYMGYKIPKGATVIMNQWAINMSPKRYESPNKFDPDRFLGDLTTASESASNPDGTKRDHFAFGAGRRICPGMHIAERTLFLSLSRLFWGFEFAVPAGTEPPDWRAVTPGLISHPVPFKCDITPRSERRTAAMRLAWREVQETLFDENEQWVRSPEGLKLNKYTADAELAGSGKAKTQEKEEAVAAAV